MGRVTAGKTHHVRTGDHRRRSVLVAEDSGGGLVDATIVEVAPRTDLPGLAELRQHLVRDAQRVDTYLEKRPAAELRLLRATVRIAADRRQVGIDHPDISDLARPDPPGHLDRRRMGAAPQRLHEEHAVLPGDRHHVLGLLRVHGEGLLDQRGLARTEREQGVPVVLGVR